MSDNSLFPKTYKPLKYLKFCSNTLIGGVSMIEIIDSEPFIPIIVGDGRVPMVWLTIKQKNSKPTPLIAANQSIHSRLVVRILASQREVIITSGATTIIRAKIQANNHGTVCIVDHLDLRPVGFNIYGNEHRLLIGDSTIKENRFEGMDFAIGLNLDDNNTAV